MIDRLIPVVILGQDDWLIFGRTADGTLVFTVIETDWHWLQSPNKGQADYGSPAWRVDNSYMHMYVSEHRDGYYWRECYTDADGTVFDWPESEDAAFIARSRQTYLCD
jgi:hypothetical protein